MGNPSDDELAQQRRAAIRQRYPVAAWDREPATLEQRLLFEILLSHAGEEGVGPVLDTEPPLNAGADGNWQAVDLLFRADLIRISPDTPIDSMVWEGHTAELTTSFRPASAIFQLPGDGRLADRAIELRRRYPTRSLLQLEDKELQQLPALASRAILLEAIRFLEFHLEQLRLPHLEPAQVEQLIADVEQRLRSLNLGRLYAVAWSAARSAADAQRRYRQIDRTATQTAVNAFVRGVDGALERDQYLEPYSLDSRLPLSALTSRIFRTTLAVDPMLTTPDEVFQRIRDQLGCQLPPSWEDTYRWFTEHPDQWSPAELDDALELLHREGHPEHPSCGYLCYYRQVQTVAGIAAKVSAGLQGSGVDDRQRALTVMQAIELADLGYYMGSSGLAALRHVLETTGPDPLDELAPFDSADAAPTSPPEWRDEWRQLNQGDLPTLPGG